jgi:hypothetical protein
MPTAEPANLLERASELAAIDAGLRAARERPEARCWWRARRRGEDTSAESGGRARPGARDDERATVLADAAALAAPALGLTGGRGAGPDASYSTLHGLYWLTTNITQRAPLALVVDDLHWADPPSLRFLGFLLPRLEGLPISRRLPHARPAQFRPRRPSCT